MYPAKTIRRLDATTVDQIAAGEVVERPASVVKELVENALDSGARSVEVSVEQGGLEAIVVVDDGCGMAAEDIELAVTRHATSKIATVHDLTAVDTYGFRGEALSSVASISRLTLTTRRPQDDVGTRIELHGGRVVACGPLGCPPGTHLEVRELFYNVPARRKFMRAPATAQAYVHDALLRCALGARRGAFRYSAGKRRLLDVPHDCEDHRRPAMLLGRRVQRLTAFATECAAGGAVEVSGYLSPPLVARAGNVGLWVFVNGRFVRDRMLQRAVLEGYQLAYPDQFVAAVVYLDVPPEAVDVNVHPQKLEVRFDDAQATFRAVREAVAVWASRLRSAELAEARSAPLRTGPSADQGHDAPQLEPAEGRSEASQDAGFGQVASTSAGGQLRLPGALATAGHVPENPISATRERVARAAARAFAAPATASRHPRAGRTLRAGAQVTASAAVLRPAVGAARLPLSGGPWQALHPLGLAPKGHLACRDGERLVLVHLAAAYAAWAHHTVLGVARPALHRLLLPPSYRPAPERLFRVRALVEEAAGAADGSSLGVHLQPLEGGRFLVQAVPACFADCTPEAVVDALSAPSVAAYAEATPELRLAAWLEALTEAEAWPTSFGEGARWPGRLLTALDACTPALAMQAPVARVVEA